MATIESSIKCKNWNKVVLIIGFNKKIKKNSGVNYKFLNNLVLIIGL